MIACMSLRAPDGTLFSDGMLFFRWHAFFSDGTLFFRWHAFFQMARKWHAIFALWHANGTPCFLHGTPMARYLIEGTHDRHWHVWHAV